MANTIKIKRSAVSGKVPAVGDLELGELAINTFDGKLFLKKNVSGNESIVDITAGGLDATSLLNLVKTVDGSGSGLDADLLDGLNSSATNLASTIVARDASGLTGLAGVNFDGTAVVTGAAGRLWYDGTTGQLNFSHDGIVTQQIGEETYVYAKASAAVTEGQVVVRTGAVGQSGSITVAPAGASLTSSDTIVGVATQTVTIGEFCRITTTGVVRGINTTGQPVGETWADGDILYYSPSGSGALTKIKPTSPNAKCVIATVISAHQSTGSIQVEIQRGSTLGGTDSNVEITSAADKDFLIYNGTNGRWENKQLVLGTDTTGNYVATIAGTANQITVSGSGSESSAVTLSLPQDIATTSTPTFAGLNIGANTISEYIADTVGAMVTSNTESGISVTYDDADNTLDFDVADFTITLTGDVTGTGTVTNLGNVSFATTIAANSVALGTDTTGNYIATIAGTTNQITVTGSGSETAAVTLSLPQDIATTSSPTFAGLTIGTSSISEYIADTVGAMVTSNTESGITVSYDDADNTLDFDVADFTITLTGDVTGTGTVTNLGNVSFAATIAANSVELGTDTTGNYVASIATTAPLSGGAVGSEGGALTLSLASGYGDTQNPYASKTANYFLAAPNGTAGAPTFRAIVAADIPTLNQNTTGNAATATKLATARTISLSGDATGSVSFDGSANADIAVTIAANSVALGTDTTGNYVATIAGTANQITVTGSGSETAAVTLSLPQDIATTSNVTFNNLTVSGNLTVNGTTTTVNSTTVTLDDPIVTLGGDTAPTVDDSKDRGVEFRWHNGTAAKIGFFGFDDSTGKFTFIPDATNTSEVFSGTKGTIDANVEWADVLNKPDPVVTVTLTGDVTGTASATLTDLASGTVSVATTIAADSVALGTDTTGNYVASITNGSYITGGNGGSEGAALTLAVDATSANTASKVVARDASGNFSAGTITATLSGNASTATKLATARTISLTGDVTGSVSFDGSADASITATIAANSVALGTDTTGNYVADVTAGSYITKTGTAGEGWSPTIAVDATSANTASKVVARDASGNFSAGTITAALSGNATTATTATNIAGGSAGTLPYQTAAGTTAMLAAGTSGYFLKSNNTSAPSWNELSLTDLPDAWVKKSVRAATTANITLSAPQTIDGVAVVAGDRVLVKDQTTASQNGIYVVAAGAWTRATDANTISKLTGALVNVDSGTANGGLRFDTDLKSTDTLDTTAVNFYKAYDVNDAATANTASKLVLRDASGNFSAGTITAALSGNASTATKLATARTINGTSFDGSANITITANTTNTLTLGTGLTGTSFNGSAAVTAAVSYGTTAGTACQGNDSRLSDSRPANGGNSDTVDNLHASSFLRSDASSTYSGGLLRITTPAGSLGSNTAEVNTLQVYQATVNTDAFMTFHVASDYAVHFGLDGTTNDLFVGGWSAGAVKNKIWHAGNDGSSSGLDADLLDGLHAATANTASTVVARDASGNFSAGTITAALTGNASTATKLATARTISLTGDVTGSVSFDGSADASITATIAANSVALGTDTTGNYVAGLTAGTGVTISGTAGEGWSPTVAIGQAVATSSNVQFNSLGVGTAGSGTAGEVRATNQVVAYYSDDRLKTKLGTIENALDKVMSLEGFYYEANQTAQDLGYEAKREVGVSAQSVQAVLPEVVKEAPISDEYLTVQYERLVPLLIQAIKEQQLQIEELKTLINK